jgi:hypothetical protein
MRREFWDNLKHISGFEAISEQALTRANDNNGKAGTWRGPPQFGS